MVDAMQRRGLEPLGRLTCAGLKPRGETRFEHSGLAVEGNDRGACLSLLPGHAARKFRWDVAEFETNISSWGERVVHEEANWRLTFWAGVW